MPGVVAMHYQCGIKSVYVQFFASPLLDAMGNVDLADRTVYVQGLASAVTDLLPGDRVSIDDVDYQVTAGPIADGFGIVTFYLDRARALTT
jgi:hypothetical protein